MSNEPLGIFEELRERAEYYARQSEALRKRILGAGPVTANGPYAQTTNPFQPPPPKPKVRMKSNKPFHKGRPPSSAPGGRRRAVWPESKLGLNVVQVVQAVVLESGIAVGELLGPCRKRYLAWPRHVAIWAIDRYCPDYSLSEIAYMFDDRDHSSIMHGIEATNVRLANDEPQTRKLVANVRRRLHAAWLGEQ